MSLKSSVKCKCTCTLFINMVIHLWYLYICLQINVITSIKISWDTSADFSFLILYRVPGFIVEAHYQCLEKTSFLCWPGFKVFILRHHFILMVKVPTSQGELAVSYFIFSWKIKFVGELCVFANRQGSCALHEASRTSLHPRAPQSISSGCGPICHCKVAMRVK